MERGIAMAAFMLITLVAGSGLVPRLFIQSGLAAAEIASAPAVPQAANQAQQGCYADATVGGEAIRTPPSSALGARLIEERFTAGKTQLVWHTFPRFSSDPLSPVSRRDAPDGDCWVGLVTNNALGGFASLAYAGDEGMADYAVEAWVRVDVSPDPPGPIQGIAIRLDPKGERFYRLAAQFGEAPRLTLAYVGRDANHFPVYLREWKGTEISGGIPKVSGWHRMKLRAVGENLWAYWADEELPGSPVTDPRIERGYFGVYTNFVGGEQGAQTLVDRVIVQSDL